MTNRQIAINFGNGSTKGKGSHLFIEGDTIYSYGYHYPLTIRRDGYYLFNTDYYSRSTARHKSYVRGEIDGELVIDCPGCDLTKAGEWLANTIAEYDRKYNHAKYPGTRRIYSDYADYYRRMLCRVNNIQL